MNISVEILPECKATLRVEVPAEKVTSERDRVVRSFAGQAKLPGFRPGKAPRQVVEKRFGPQIENELSDRLINEGCREGIREKDLKVLAVTAVEQTEYHPDGTFSFVAALTTAPAFELPAYDGIPVRVPKTDVSDEDVEKALESFRERFADFEDVTDRAVETGDIAVLDYKGTIEGKPVGEILPKANAYIAQNHDYWMKVDEGVFLPGFATQLVGLNVGESRTVNVTLPDDFPLPDGVGKTIDYEVTVKGIKRQVLPEVDDALAAKIDPGTTLAELRDRVRARILEHRLEQVENMKIEQIVGFFTNNLDFEVPPDYVQSETQNRVNEMVERGQKAGLEDDQIMERQQEIFDAATLQARNNVKTSFILHEIAKKEGIRVSDSEIVSRVEALAAAYKMPVKKVAKRLRDGNGISRIRENILVRKTLEFLKSKASVEEFEPAEGTEGETAQV